MTPGSVIWFVTRVIGSVFFLSKYYFSLFSTDSNVTSEHYYHKSLKENVPLESLSSCFLRARCLHQITLLFEQDLQNINNIKALSSHIHIFPPSLGGTGKVEGRILLAFVTHHIFIRITFVTWFISWYCCSQVFFLRVVFVYCLKLWLWKSKTLKYVLKRGLEFLMVVQTYAFFLW